MNTHSQEINRAFHNISTGENMKYSFIIPMFNEEHDIEATVDRVLAQEHQYFEMEIILIDDGSKDGTYRLCTERYASNSAVQILHSEENRGVSHARNIGVEASSGDVVIFLNADELVEPDFLRRIDQHYQKNADYVFPQTRVRNCNTAYGMFRDRYRLTKYSRPNTFMWSQGFSCRKELFIQAGGFSESYPGCGGEDWDFVSRLDMLYKNRVVDLNIVVKHTVPEKTKAVLWHMYNRGRGSSYYDLIYRKKSPYTYLLQLIVHIVAMCTVLVWDYRILLCAAILVGANAIYSGWKLCERGNKGVHYIVFFSIADKVIRYLGYSINMFKNLRLHEKR